MAMQTLLPYLFGDLGYAIRGPEDRLQKAPAGALRIRDQSERTGRTRLEANDRRPVSNLIHVAAQAP